MEWQEDRPAWDTGTLEDSVRQFVAEGGESGRTMLREAWVASTIALLRSSRLRAGLTQQQVADALGTSQPAIARLERGDDMTLRRFWDFLSACGEAPFDIEAAPINGLLKFVEAHPDSRRTASHYQEWLDEREEREKAIVTPSKPARRRA